MKNENSSTSIRTFKKERKRYENDEKRQLLSGKADLSHPQLNNTVFFKIYLFLCHVQNIFFSKYILPS